MKKRIRDNTKRTQSPIVCDEIVTRPPLCTQEELYKQSRVVCLANGHKTHRGKGLAKRQRDQMNACKLYQTYLPRKPGFDRDLLKHIMKRVNEAEEQMNNSFRVVLGAYGYHPGWNLYIGNISAARMVARKYSIAFMSIISMSRRGQMLIKRKYKSWLTYQAYIEHFDGWYERMYHAHQAVVLEEDESMRNVESAVDEELDQMHLEYDWDTDTLSGAHNRVCEHTMSDELGVPKGVALLLASAMNSKESFDNYARAMLNEYSYGF